MRVPARAFHAGLSATGRRPSRRVLSIPEQAPGKKARAGTRTQKHPVPSRDQFPLMSLAEPSQISGSVYRVRWICLVGHSLCVLEHGRLNGLGRLLLALDQSLDVLHGFGGEVLLPRLLTNARRHVFDQVESAAMLQRVRYLGLDHCFSHTVALSICFPDSVVGPKIWIRFIYRDDLDQWPTRITTLHVKGSIPSCESEDKATWSIRILGIVLNHFTLVRYCLFQFAHADGTQDRLIDGVPRILVLPCRDLIPDTFKGNLRFTRLLSDIISGAGRYFKPIRQTSAWFGKPKNDKIIYRQNNEEMVGFQVRST